ncbi:uncharacterized protein LOC111377730 [Olea europaea var. sylvestris]|uniref:uncharacterized protein LOC111377730 n=1 Tax=Olea europaea var. sylvestris TaxID=158386 RepID=UPI000C1D4D41|nr:uncharacterized protein LOC111377730 [Olea europaea var. sylvestris]
MVDSSFNGSLFTKTIDKVHKLFETMATTSAMWTSEWVVQRRTPGVCEIDAYPALSAMIDSLFHKVESMSQSANATYARKPNCEECGANHSTAECPILSQRMEQVEYMQWGQHQQNYRNSNTYNSSWKEHPNLSWGDGTDGTRYNEKGTNTLPSNTELNSRKHVQAITTRSRMQLPERYIEKRSVNNETTPSTEVEIRLGKYRMEQQYKKFLEIFKKLYINIPFVDALLQMPSYGKFLKDILTNNR